MLRCLHLSLLLVCLTSALFLSSCATARVEISDQSFVPEKIGAHKLGIGPVVQVDGEPILGHQAEIFRNELRRAMSNKRSYIQVAGNIGPNLLGNPGGTAERAISSSLRSSAKSRGMRYLMVTEVSRNDISHDTDRSCEEETEKIYAECGKYIGTRVISTTYTSAAITQRTVAARFKVIDLYRGKTVWVSRSEMGTANRSENESCYRYPPTPSYPSAPRADNVVDKLSRAAVRKLPRNGW